MSHLIGAWRKHCHECFSLQNLAALRGPLAHMPAVPFHGPNQAGITTPRQPAGIWTSFDVIAEDRAGLIDLLKTLTTESRFLTTGGTVPDPYGNAGPPTDSRTLGTDVPADGLTITLALGASLFDHRFGIADARPVHLTAMEPFPNDDLNPALTGGDLLLQICGGARTRCGGQARLVRVQAVRLRRRWGQSGVPWLEAAAVATSVG